MWAVILLLVVFSGSMAIAQDTTPVVADSVASVAFEPYIATITGNSVYVRSNPGKPYHPVCKLSKGYKVVVRGIRYGTTNWAKIEPTAGCFCYIAKKYGMVG